MTRQRNAANNPFGRVAGVSRADITPPVGILSGTWGAAAWDRVTGVHRPLTATALYFGVSPASGDISQHTPGVLLISLDLGAWRKRQDEWRLRSAVLAATGLPESAVAIHLVHTHSCSSICSDDVNRPGGELIPGYLDELRDTVVRIAQQAIARALPARVSWGTGHSGLAGCRDLPLGDRYVVGWNPGSASDQTVTVGRISRVDNGAPLATVVEYGCHPTTLGWENSLLSPDYVGAVRQVVEKGTGGAPCLFLYGCGGDQAPREQYSGDVELADRNGSGLGHAALAVLSAMPAITAPAAAEPIGVIHPTVRLPMKPVEGVEDLALRFWPTLDERTRTERVRRALWRRGNAGTGPDCDYPLWLWWLDGALFIAQPGEAYADLAIQLRRRHPKITIVCASLVNGPASTYLPRRELFSSNVYQVWHTFFQAGCHEAVLAAVDQIVTAGRPAADPVGAESDQ